MTEAKTMRLLTEQEAADILRGGGSKNATARTVRWLVQRPDAPSRPDLMIDLAQIAEYLRRITREDAPGLRGVARLFDRIVPKGARPRALSSAEREARAKARDSHSDICADLDRAIEGIDWERRARASADLLEFLRVYCTSDDPNDGALLEIPPPDEMQPIVRDIEQAVGDASIPYHIRIARGHGKTAYSKGAALWTLATGRRRYVVVVGSNDTNAANIVEDVFNCLTKSPRFVADFPEVAVPFRKFEGAWQRARMQKYHGQPTNARRSESRIVLPTVADPKTGKPFPASGGILEAVGFNAGARGKAHGILRPDFLILDDLQNDDKAQSDGQVGKMAAKVRKTFMGLAGHRKKIAAIMTSTPIEADDLSETFAADSGWKTKTYPMLKSWPKCHNLDAPAEERKGIRDWWDEYWGVYNAEKAADREPHIAANAFYAAHRAEMDEGAEVLNPQNFDPLTELSGVQHALNILFRDGEDAFMCEYQMRPPRQTLAVEISAKLIMSRVRPGVRPGTIPEGAAFVCAATDINPGYGLTTTLMAFDARMTAFVTHYHVTPVKISERLNDNAFDAKLTAALRAHRDEIAALGVPVETWGIDAGGRQFATVTKFTAAHDGESGVRVVAMLGRAGQNWNPNVRSRIRSERNETILCRDPQRRRWLAWNADSYKERAHRAWGTEVGAYGGLTLFDGGVNHYKFAAQVANERLVSKSKVKTASGVERYAYRWKTKNPHDYGDCVAMCYALAGDAGISGEGAMLHTVSKSVKVGGMAAANPAAPSANLTEAQLVEAQAAPKKKACRIGRAR